MVTASSACDYNASRVGTVLGAYIAPIPLILLSTGLRIVVKLRKTNGDKIALDDCLIVFATVGGPFDPFDICAVGECIAGLVYGPPHGFGRHTCAVRPEDLMIFQIGNYVFSHFYNITLGMIKLSILTFYYRIFVTPIFRRIVLATITFIILWVLTITIVLALQCRPIERFWNPTVPGTCFNLVAFSYFTNITNLVTDVWIFLLPVPLILRLHISGGRKLGLCVVFMVGLATCIISSVRLSVVVAQGSPDFMWDGIPLGALSVFEPLGGILSANLPIIYVLFATSFRRLKKSFSETFSGSTKLVPFSQGSRRFRSREGSDRSAEQWIKLPKANWSNEGKSSGETMETMETMHDKHARYTMDPSP